jgi:AcrR family transcriptional regulator
MRVRDWQDILDDVTDANADPDGWRAIAGQRRGGVGEDLYLGHPGVGVYHLKTYAKNPYDVRGVGAKVARKIDDGIDPHLPDEELRRRFAVQSPPADEDEAASKARRLEETVKVHAEAPTTPDDLFRDVMDAIDSPAYGPMEYELSERPDDLDALSETFDEAEELLTAELDDLVERDEVGRGFY